MDDEVVASEGKKWVKTGTKQIVAFRGVDGFKIGLGSQEYKDLSCFDFLCKTSVTAVL